MTPEQEHSARAIVSGLEGPAKLGRIAALPLHHPGWLLLSPEYLTEWQMEAIADPHPYRWLFSGHHVAYRILEFTTPRRKDREPYSLVTPVVLEDARTLQWCTVRTWDHLLRTQARVLKDVNEETRAWVVERFEVLNDLLAPACRYALELSDTYPEEVKR